jgi:geranylgeranyl pyrophosphate synthase
MRSTIETTAPGPEGQGSFMEYIEKAKEKVNRRIEGQISLLATGGSEIGDHFRGGKRLRAGTTLLVHDALFNEEGSTDMAVDLAAAVEFAHGISLVIDDVMDGDTVRRGGPSIHAAMGKPRAMLEALRLVSVPYTMVAPHGPAMTEHLAAAHEGVVRGALLEMELQGPRISMAAYDRLISLKTGSFFGLAARFGGLAAGCCEEKAALAEAYGIGLGNVHQIADDIADLSGALIAGRDLAGSEALLFRCVVTDPGERERAVDAGKLSNEAKERLERELHLRVRRAQRSVRKLAGSVGRCGGRSFARSLLPIMLSAPLEIAAVMLSSTPDTFIRAPSLGCSEDRS